MILFEDATLKITIAQVLNTDIIEINILELKENNEIVITEHEIRPPADGTFRNYFFKLPHKELVALTIKKKNLLNSLCYAKATLVKGNNINAKELITIISGHLSSSRILSYPPISTEKDGDYKGLYIYNVNSITPQSNCIIAIDKFVGNFNLTSIDPANEVVLLLNYDKVFANIPAFSSPAQFKWLGDSYGETKNVYTGFYNTTYYSNIPKDFILKENDILTLEIKSFNDVNDTVELFIYGYLKFVNIQ